MQQVKARELGKKTSEVVQKILNGETLILIENNEPIAIVVPISSRGFKAMKTLSEIGKILKESGLEEDEVIKVLN